MLLLLRKLFALLFLFHCITAEEVDEDEYVNHFSVCEDSVIIVEEISIVCDSPGTYYYGSSQYRNSEKCQAGDKAHLQVDFFVNQELEAAPYMTLFVQGYGSVQDVYVHTDEEICSLSNLQVDSGGCDYQYGTAPQVGYYTLQETFYWGEQKDDYKYSFLPKVVVGFSSVANNNKYDLGGANTNNCQGDSFMKWTNGLGKNATHTLRSFLLAFGLLLGAIGSMCMAVCCIMRQARLAAPPPSVDNAELLEKREESNKIATVGNQKALVDY